MELSLAVSQFYVVLGIVLAVAGMVRMLLVQDLMARLMAMNVVGVGSLLILLALAARSDPLDPGLSALVITGLVITVAFTGVGAVLIRRIEATRDGDRAS
ncbi:NADH-quinone oxidoreductase subunit K [Kocuria marina]|uniref:Multisubunit sodium/proton antiporter, MrpC subunit n=1 Tax=Kocuria marina subsp. indica TaxID=1049583 RepID=A0A1X7D9I3_9MICC|nr:NADH-quinone oxidoreductase subunit K [Kocuria indica]SMF10957.1 multisubunit sodium/proton antiporter, MrpC subunit [Kocuria indica]